MLPDEQLKMILTPMMEQYPQEGMPEMSLDDMLASPMIRPMLINALASGMAQSELNEANFGGLTVDEIFVKLTTDGEGNVNEEALNTLYNNEAIPHDYSSSNYLKNLTLLGNVNEDSPKTIYLYSPSFEDKDRVGELIGEYNDSVGEEQKISYTDYVKILMSSITTVLNAITYVLIAFVAISLVVSSIMIGIITYISVLERTKEIGILRAIGASKRDVGRVFNAETLIVGFVAGMIGIGATLLLNQAVNRILFHFTEIPNLKAILPVGGAVILVLISMLLTFIAGLLPSGFAAKKNPVEALRSE